MTMGMSKKSLRRFGNRSHGMRNHTVDPVQSGKYCSTPPVETSVGADVVCDGAHLPYTCVMQVE